MQVSGERACVNRQVKIQTRVALEEFRCRYRRRSHEWYQRKEHRVGPHDRVAGKVLVAEVVGVGRRRIQPVMSHSAVCNLWVGGTSSEQADRVEECRQCQ